MIAGPLDRRWRDLVPPGAAAQDLGRDLLTRWAEPHRRYHGTAHLVAVLDAVDELAAAGTPVQDPTGAALTGADLTAVRLAAWFHDAVYEGRPGLDEEASASLATRTLLALGVPGDRVDEVARLVWLTARHDPAADDRAGALLCDADLAVLGSTPQAYDGYSRAVREEYAAVPEGEYRAGRAAVLRRLLELDPLYRTAEGRRRWDAAARRNLTAELRLLGGPPT